MTVSDIINLVLAGAVIGGSLSIHFAMKRFTLAVQDLHDTLYDEDDGGGPGGGSKISNVIDMAARRRAS